MNDKKKLYKDIEELTTELKLPGVKSSFEEYSKEACINDVSYEEFLYKLLGNEQVLRNESNKQNRIRIAKFPYKKYIEDLVIEDLPVDAKKKLKTLSSLEFITTGQNVILAGNPGTGNYRKFLFIERILIISSNNVLYILKSFDNNYLQKS